MNRTSLHRQTGEGRERNRQYRRRISARSDDDEVALPRDGDLDRLRARLELRPQRLGFELTVSRLVPDQTGLISALSSRELETRAVVEEDRDLRRDDHQQHEEADRKRELDQCLSPLVHSRASVPISGVNTRNITSTNSGSTKKISVGTVIKTGARVIRSR